MNEVVKVKSTAATFFLGEKVGGIIAVSCFAGPFALIVALVLAVGLAGAVSYSYSEFGLGDKV